jgi:hypothetical protein
MAMTGKHEPHPNLSIVQLTDLINDSITSKKTPEGFDPRVAPQQDLDHYGFPQRPDPALQPSARAFWDKLFEPPVVFDAFKFQIVPVFTTSPRRMFVAQLSRLETSSNWSGAYIMPRDGTIFQSVWGSYQVPTPNQPTGEPAGPYASSTWIGIDGQRLYYNSTLPQFGTAQNVDTTSGAPVRSYFAWWQWWARGVAGAAFPVTITTMTINAGDLIMLFMQVANNRAGVSFVMRNVSTGHVVHFVQGPPSPTSGLPFGVSGATAEWVMERPALPPNPAPLQLADYGTVDFHDCGATAINPDTGATVDRSISAATLIDMCVVKEGPERTWVNSIAKPINTSAFLTRYRY